MARKGKLPTDVKALARVHTATALNVLAKVMAADSAPPAARVAAATAILNRGWGQPHQSVDLTAEVVTTKVIRTPAPQNNLETWKQQFSDQAEPRKIN